MCLSLSILHHRHPQASPPAPELRKPSASLFDYPPSYDGGPTTSNTSTDTILVEALLCLCESSAGSVDVVDVSCRTFIIQSPSIISPLVQHFPHTVALAGWLMLLTYFLAFCTQLSECTSLFYQYTRLRGPCIYSIAATFSSLKTFLRPITLLAPCSTDRLIAQLFFFSRLDHF